MQMSPRKFKEQTTVLKSPIKGKGQKEMQIPVCVSRENGGYISKWDMSFWDKLMFLFGIKSIWLVVYGSSHPPVFMTCKRTVFQKEKEAI